MMIEPQPGSRIDMGQAETNHIVDSSVLRVSGLEEFALLPGDATFTRSARTREASPNTLTHLTAPVIPNSKFLIPNSPPRPLIAPKRGQKTSSHLTFPRAGKFEIRNPKSEIYGPTLLANSSSTLRYGSIEGMKCRSSREWGPMPVWPHTT